MNLVFFVVKLFSQLPVFLKSSMSNKSASIFIRKFRTYIPSDIYISSNLGIDSKYEVKLPLNEAPGFLFFGKPNNYSGEFETLELCNLLLKESSVFVDIGANWGYYTYFLHHNFPEKKIYFFEPNSKLYDNISLNIETNKLPNIYGFKLGISDTQSTINFYIEEGAALTSSIIKPESGNYNVKSIDVVSFDFWLSGSNFTENNLLVKVDVENAEWQFIFGAKNSMDRIKFLVIELLGPARQSGIVNHLINNFQLNAFYINRMELVHITSENNIYTVGQYNWLFTKLSPMELSKIVNPAFQVK